MINVHHMHLVTNMLGFLKYQMPQKKSALKDQLFVFTAHVEIVYVHDMSFLWVGLMQIFLLC